jgi:hypothetical protein
VRRAPALLLLLGLAACGSDPVPVDLSAEVRQYRNDVALRRLSVTVTNDGDRPVSISGVRLAAPGFAPLPAADPEVDLPRGDRVDLPVPYGEVSCGPGSSGGPDRAELLVRAGDDERRLTVELPSNGGLLQRLRDKDCAQQALARTVTLALGPGWVRVGKRLQGTLVLTRGTRDDPATLTEAGGTIVYTVRPRGLPAVLRPGSPRLEVPVVVTATRCDGHALSQNSRGAVFTFYVAVGAAEPVQVPVLADQVLQGQLAQLAADTCLPAG